MGKGPNLEPGTNRWFTDGSLKTGGVGLGVTGPNCNLSIAVGNSPSIFQEEIYAITVCARMIHKWQMGGGKLAIASDSQAAIKALSSFVCEPRIVWECRESLQQLAEHNRVSLLWVPRHSGVPGNERADELANRVAGGAFMGPETFYGIPKSHISELLKLWETKNTEVNWTNTPGLIHVKYLICLSGKKAKEMLTLSRTEIILITGMLTGHGPTKHHLKKIGKLEEKTCRFCKKSVETAEHILTNCEALALRRYQHIQKGIAKP